MISALVFSACCAVVSTSELSNLKNTGWNGEFLLMSPMSREAIGSSATGSGGTGRGSSTGVGGAGGRESAGAGGGGGDTRATGGAFLAHPPATARTITTTQQRCCLCVIISALSLLEPYFDQLGYRFVPVLVI